MNWLPLPPIDKLYKFYAIVGMVLVIVPMTGLISFALFIHGLTSNALLGNDNIKIESKFIEINVQDTTKHVEILDHFVEQHLLATEKEARSELMSIRRSEEPPKLGSVLPATIRLIHHIIPFNYFTFTLKSAIIRTNPMFWVRPKVRPKTIKGHYGKYQTTDREAT